MANEGNNKSSITPRAMRRRKSLFRFTALLASLVFTVLAIELGLRLAGYTDFRGVSYATNDSELSWVNKPGADVDVRGVDYEYDVKINSLGLRGEELRQSADFRILVLGDSYTFGEGVGNADTWAVQLETLCKDLTFDVEVVNGGVYGYGAMQAKGLAMRVWNAVQPDIVIYSHCGNDFADDLRFHQGTYRMVRNRIPGRKFLRENSALYNLSKPVALALLSKIGVYNMESSSESDDEGGTISNLGELRKQGRDLTWQAVQDIHTTCESRGARFYVTTVGFFVHNSKIRFSTDAREIRKMCLEHGIGFLDPTLLFDLPEVQARPWHNDHTVGHYSPYGNRMFAESIFRELVRENAFSGSAKQ